ncbi:hypothetical protein [Streptomyces canus]|uniref:hypothetical protein n=1 Tax=Streptomyces canus TaxID=58343 RepID=UPI0036E55520
MNTERPDNNDPGEASGGEDGSAVEAHGVGEASAAEERGSETSGDEGTSRAGAGGDGGAEGTERAAATAEGSAGPAEGAADTDGSAASDAGAGAGAADLSKLAAPQPSADADMGATPASDAGAGAGAGEPDHHASPGSPADISKLTAPETAAADQPTGLEQPQPSADADADTHTTPTTDAGAGAPAPGLPDSEIPRHEGADASRPARHRSPVTIATVAAAVLLVGGGGAYLAAGASGGSGDDTTSGASGDGTPPPLALDGYRAGGGGGNGIAPGEPNPYGATYRVDGSLPDGPDSAPVYRTQGQVTEADVARLAEALGVGGTPVAQGQIWRIGVKDGSGPSLTVNRQAPGAWTFQRYSPVVDGCRSATVCETPTGRPVSEAAAEKAAAPVLKAVGQGTAKLDASQAMGAQRIVNADPVVGGLPTYGWATGVTVNGQGEVVGGTGQLKAPVKSDTYPVLSAEKTLGLLNKMPAADHRMGIGGCASPVPLKDRLEAPCGEPSGARKSTLTVEKAVFGLASHFVGGRQALVPSWLFEVRATGAKDAFTVTYPAVDPRYIASPATATPTTPASPTAPSDRPSAAPKTRDVEVDGYTAEGDELTVSFTGGVCGDYAAKAAESAGEVKVKVTFTPWQDQVCIAIAKEMQKTVTLDEPLGDRKVVGSDGKEIPLKKAGARLPETSGAR